MGFWSKTSAAPSFWQIAGLVSLEPGYIRPAAIPLPATKKDEYVIRLNSLHAQPLAKFLQQYYCGDDWELDNTISTWINLYLSDINIIVIGLLHEEELIATIISTPVGKTIMSHGATVSNLRVAEGLCVHDAYRSTGVAGFMIEYIDAYTSQREPTAHLWSREMVGRPFISSAFSRDTYAYARCAICPLTLPVVPMAWPAFQELWTSNTSFFSDPSIVVLAPSNRRGGLLVFEIQNHIVVISKTGRRTKQGHLPIFEVVWCGLRRETALISGHCTEAVLTSVAAYLHIGILFASSSTVGGGVVSGWEYWSYGNSGYHAWYLFNYIPPSFGSCTLHAIREEI